MNKVKSDFTKKVYDLDKSIRIINMSQLAAYMANDVELLDLYVSRDFKTNKPMLVGVVDREQSREAYDLWCKHELE